MSADRRPATEPVFLTVAEVAERTGLTQYEVRSEVRRGVFPHRAIGTRPLIRFTREDIDAYVERVAARKKKEAAPSGLTPGSRARRRTA